MDDSRQFHEGVRGGTLSGIPVTAQESGLSGIGDKMQKALVASGLRAVTQMASPDPKNGHKKAGAGHPAKRRWKT